MPLALLRYTLSLSGLLLIVYSFAVNLFTSALSEENATLDEVESKFWSTIASPNTNETPLKNVSDSRFFESLTNKISNNLNILNISKIKAP